MSKNFDTFLAFRAKYDYNKSICICNHKNVKKKLKYFFIYY